MLSRHRVIPFFDVFSVVFHYIALARSSNVKFVVLRCSRSISDSFQTTVVDSHHSRTIRSPRLVSVCFCLFFRVRFSILFRPVSFRLLEPRLNSFGLDWFSFRFEYVVLRETVLESITANLRIVRRASCLGAFARRASCSAFFSSWSCSACPFKFTLNQIFWSRAYLVVVVRRALGYDT